MVWCSDSRSTTRVSGSQRLLEEVTVPLGTGDVFLFYTDGITEAMDQDGDCFGDARLAAVVQEHADAAVR